jgi:hypothetical protein
MKTKLIITEEQYNQLIYSKLGLLTEASKKKVLMDKVGLSEENAEYLDKRCGGLSVWMANKVIDYQIKAMKSWVGFKDSEITKEKALEKINSAQMKNWYGARITEIMDWIRVGLNGNVNEYKNLSLTELGEESKRWHESLGVSGGEINYDEKHDIIKDFRDKDGNGFYWADLDTKNSPEECERMGHCGISSYGYLYSLRETKPINDKYKINKSHLTAAIGPDGTMYQLKGPKNSKPKEEFHQYILPLFFVEDEDGKYLVQDFGSEYASDRDFKLSDLPDDVIRKLYQDRPGLFSGRSMQKKLVNMGIIEAPNIDYNITLNIDPDAVQHYVDGDWIIRRFKRKVTTPAGQEYEKTVEVTMFEAILSGDAWELWYNYDVDWKMYLQYEVDDENEKKIRDLLRIIASKDNDEFDSETFENEDIEGLINYWDDDYAIRRAISSAASAAESDDYVNYLYKTLKDALEEYGTVEKMNDEGVILHINTEPFLDQIDDSYLDQYMEICDEDIECVFKEALDERDIEKPKADFDDRYYPDVDKGYFNDMLKENLGEVEYNLTK